jgi:hypothetical protein
MSTPAVDPVALRVARRYEAAVERWGDPVAQRVALQYIRRTEGLVRVDGDEEDEGGDDADDPRPLAGTWVCRLAQSRAEPST